MHSVKKVRTALLTDTERVANILGEAFNDDPIFRWLIPNDTARRVGLPHYFRVVGGSLYLPKGLSFVSDDGFGAALWLPPGACSDPPLFVGLRLAWRLLCAAGIGGMRRAARILSVFHARRPISAHYYLHAIGVPSAHRGQGRGSALIHQVTTRCDLEGLPAYLESSSERNLALYERHGFRVDGQWQPPAGGLTVWFMTRPPGSGAATSQAQRESNVCCPHQ
jgi:GNAT superfamily N-acetyltransferase